MWILNSIPPFIHRSEAKVTVNFNMTGVEEAKKAVISFNEVLAATEKHAQEVLKIIRDINAEVDKLEKRTPKDSLADPGLG